MVLSRLLRLKTSFFPYEPPKRPQTLIRLLSTSALHHDLPPPPTPPTPPAAAADPKNTLSARMSFVFDQIDAIQRDRGEKDEALQRIRAWRHSKQQQQQQVEVKVEEAEEEEGMRSVIKEVELVHPWPEWIELMERLLQQNYFDHRRVDEDKMVENLPAVDLSGYAGRDMAGSEFWRDWAAVCTACRNFGHDRFDILKSLSRKDIQVLVGYGCPSMDGKVVYSAKLLRKLAHVNEGDVCSVCSLRSSCKKGFLLVPKEDEARTLDVMRVLLTFGFDSINGSVKNRPLIKMKSVKTVVRKLLHEIVKLAAIPIDPNLPRPVIKKPPPKVKQTPPPPKKRVGRDDVEMKKGDWLCSKCDFMNFAKNAICLQCDAKRPKRQLLPGEWECPECNFLNYRRNMACFHCECKRPPDEYMENQVRAKQQEPRTGSLGNLRKPNVSDAWNFDFDENESDGADVAAFEFADPPRMGDSASLNGSTHGETSRRCDVDFDDLAKMPRNHERSKYFSESDEKGVNSHAQKTGFDDFDDEEYDVDSYEIDMSHNNKASAISRRNLSEFENSSESEDFDDLDHCEHSRGVKASISGSNEIMMGSDSEGDLVDQPKWKSTRYKGVSYVHSDSDDDLRKGHERVLNRNITARQIRSCDRASSSRKSFESNDAWLSRGAHRNDRDSVCNGIRGRMGNDRGGDSGRYNRPRHGMESGYNHYRNDRESSGEQKGNNRSGDSWSSDKPDQREGFEYNHNRSNEYNHRSKFDDRPRAQKGNSRRGDFWGSDRLPRWEGFEYSRLRSNEHDERSKFDDGPRRRIIER